MHILYCFTRVVVSYIQKIKYYATLATIAMQKAQTSHTTE